MKMFRNPWVAGAVGILAVVVVLYVVLLPHIRRTRGSRASASAAGTTGAKGASSVDAPPPKTVPPPAMEIDRKYVQAHYPGWISGPVHDPFQMFGAPIQLVSGPAVPSPVLSWKLKAIWRQTGGSIAAINNGVYTEGDDIQGYKVDRIEGDRVWFQGVGGPESLDFGNHAVVTITATRGTNFIERFLGPEQADPLRPKL